MPSFFLPSFQLRKPGFSGHFVALVFASVLTLATGQARAWSLDVAGLAHAQALASFKPASHAMPAELANLDYDGYRAFLQHNNQTLSETWTNLITP
jgi:periplasmic glucans biosynthesis protein